MGLFDLIEQDHGIGLATHLLGQLTAFFITHIARRRTDQTAHGELLHVLGHVELDEGLIAAKHLLGQRASQQCLSDAGRAQQSEAADRALRILEVGSGATQCLGQRSHSIFLTDDQFGQLVLNGQELLHVGLAHPLEGNARPLSDHLKDVIFGDHHPLLVLGSLPVGQRLLEAFFGRFLMIAQLGRSLEVLILDGLFFLLPQ